MAELVQAGKVKALGLSEASAATIRRAHACIRSPRCRANIRYGRVIRKPRCSPLAASSASASCLTAPWAEASSTGAIRNTEALGDNDWRRTQPRFQADTIKANLSLVETLEQIAREKGVTAAQLVLSWVLHQGDFIVPIPGVRKVKHLEDNVGAVDVTLTPGGACRNRRSSPERGRRRQALHR